MHYQVVARTSIPAGEWEYYPYWAPVRDKDAATRLASYAAQAGYEAAILQSVTAEMLRHIATGVVERQDTRLLPALRYQPGTRVAAASGHREYDVETAFHLSNGSDPYGDSPNKAELDGRRLTLEMGPGGDIVLRTDWRQQPIALPCRMDVLRIWMDLRRRLLGEQLGGPSDGALDDSQDA